MADIEIALLIDRLMRRIHVTLQARASEFDTEDVGPNGGILLLTLAEMTNASMHDLSQALARDKSQMSRLIQSLEGKDLVSRTPSPDDGRVTRVALTDKGSRVVEDLRAALAQAIGDIMTGITPEEKSSFRALLHRIVGTPRQAGFP